MSQLLLVRRMSVMFMEASENPTRLTVCPRCGKQV